MLGARHDHRLTHWPHCNKARLVQGPECYDRRHAVATRGSASLAPARRGDTGGRGRAPVAGQAAVLYNAGDYDGAIDAAAVARRSGVGRRRGTRRGSRAPRAISHQARPVDLASARTLSVGSRGCAHAARPARPAGRPRTVALSRRDVWRGGGAVRHGAEPAILIAASATDCCCSTGGRPRSIARRGGFRRIAAAPARGRARRMEEELRQDPGNRVANYWLAARPAAPATSSAPGTPPWPPGCGRRCGPTPPPCCGPTSTGSSPRRSSPSEPVPGRPDERRGEAALQSRSERAEGEWSEGQTQ